MKRFAIIFALLAALATPVPASAFDYTFTFTHTMPAEMAGYRVKYGAVKGGPYTGGVVDCGKPAVKSDGTMDCPGPGIIIPPSTLYAVAVAVMASGNESPPSAEASFTPAAPGALRFILSGTITLIPAP